MLKIEWQRCLIYLIGDWVIFGLHVSIYLEGGPASDTPLVARAEQRLQWSWNDGYHNDPTNLNKNFLRFYFDTRQARWRSKSIAWVRRCEDFGCNQ